MVRADGSADGKNDPDEASALCVMVRTSSSGSPNSFVVLIVNNVG